MIMSEAQGGGVGGHVAPCAAFTGGVASVYLWESFNAVLGLCASIAKAQGTHTVSGSHKVPF